MQMNNVSILSQNFIGEPQAIIKEVSAFLADVKLKNTSKAEFNLVHALVFSKAMSESDVHSLNLGLSDAYRKSGFDVLGGDTSSGAELSIFISTIVC
jgi:thiamine monophosphate kinase